MKAKYYALIGFVLAVVFYYLSSIISSMFDIFNSVRYVLGSIYPLTFLVVLFLLLPLLLLLSKNKICSILSIISGSLLITGFGLVLFKLVFTVSRRLLGYSPYTSNAFEVVLSLLLLGVFIVSGVLYIIAGIKALKEGKEE